MKKARKRYQSLSKEEKEKIKNMVVNSPNSDKRWKTRACWVYKQVSGNEKAPYCNYKKLLF